MKFKLHKILGGCLLASLLFSACDTEFKNPNAATGDQVLTSPDGLLGLVVGTKREFSVGGASCLYSSILASGLSTKELTVLNTGNGQLSALESGGGTVGGANTVTTAIWTSCNQVKKQAQLLINNASSVADAQTSASIKTYGHMFKALAIGTMAQHFEQITTDVLNNTQVIAGEKATFKARTVALQEAVTELNSALSTLPATGTSAYFNSKVGTDIDIKNTLNALLARYKNMLGDHDGAIAAANAVDLTKKSQWRYDTQSQNPVYRSGLVSANVVGGKTNFGLQGGLIPTAGDGRIAFYLGNSNALVLVTGFFKADNDAIPVYLPDEMRLIRAEAYARKGGAADLTASKTELDAVIKDNSDVWGVKANIAAGYTGATTQAALLEETYRQRAIELYLTGLKMEDARRFDRSLGIAATSERTRNFYPYPQSERDNNSNTPTDPSN